MFHISSWEFLPADFERFTWTGDGDQVADAMAIIHRDSQVSIFKLELTDNDRRQLIEGNPVYLAIRGRVPPFAITANLGEVTELAR
jgi:hypothetical protein